MPGEITELTEIGTALGMLAPSIDEALITCPPALRNVSDAVWDRLVEHHHHGTHRDSLATAFDNGRAFLHAGDGLRGRRPLRVEWKGPHRPPGDDVIPADLRVDRVYLVSCKYLSKVLVNPGPPRLFDRLLVGEERSTLNWFAETAPEAFQDLYDAARRRSAVAELPALVEKLTRAQQKALKAELNQRQWPEPLQPPWVRLCAEVSAASVSRWRAAMATRRDQLRLLWRMLRITTATYFVLGADHRAHLRLRIDSAWDWTQAFDLRAFEVEGCAGGQPQVSWQATVRRRVDGSDVIVAGHVEIRWSHGRFVGSPEAKVYLDSPHAGVPGYHPLADDHLADVGL